MKFSIFASYLQDLEKTQSRLEMTEILASLFKKAKDGEIDKLCYLSLGRLAPKYEGIEFNMAEKMVVRAIAKALAAELKEVERVYKQEGDLGNTIEKLCNLENKKFKITKLDVIGVYHKLRNIAEDSGEGSVERKINKLAMLLQELDSLSVKYVVRIPVNKLRLGFSDMTILDALSWMKQKDKSLRKDLEKAFNVLADIGKIAKTFKTKGLKGIKKISSEVGVPIRAAKAERLPNAQKILEKMEGQCVLEPKYDGFRVQIHIDKTKKFELEKDTNLSLFEKKANFMVRIFSRNLDNMTYMFPDVVEAVQAVRAKRIILDGEAIAFNAMTGKFLSFQETVQRKRKHGVGKKAKEIPLKVFVFDVLYLNGKTLLGESFKNRRRILEDLFKSSHLDKQKIMLTEQKTVDKPEEFDEFFKTIVKEGLEGLMAKKLDAVYQAGARNYNWVKYKVAMQSELADTIDCVVMGYYFGKGKRTSFGIGAFLVGILNKGKLLTVSKIGTGLTDKQWQEMFKRCKKLEVTSKPKDYQVNKNLNPDVWCRPELVVEIEADTITRSPIHSASLALRFPRLKKFRDDKNTNQATTLSELKKLAGFNKNN